MHIRPATLNDAAAMLAIYAPIVRETAVSFELVPPTQAEFEARIAKYTEGWAWLVAEVDGMLAGYAYGSGHRERPAYRLSTETSVYVAPAAQGRGVGKQLYQALLGCLAERGFCNAYAGIAWPNSASVALHRAVGFCEIGRFPAVGRKFNQWHDMVWFHRPLRVQPLAEPAP